MNILEQTTIRAPSGKDDICAKFIIDDIDTPFVFHDIVQNGEQYTLSFYIKAETSGSITASGAGMEVSAEWARHIVTFIADSADVQVYFNAIGTYCIYNAQLEIGCKATDFVIAPEDVDEDILAVSSRTAELEVGLAGIVSRVSTTETMLVGTESRLTTVETLATQTADKFNWLVKSGDNETNFTLTDHTATLIAQTISLNGNVKVNGAMIVDGSITSSELAVGAVTADKVLAGAITTDKLAASAVTAAKIAASAITADKIAASAITSAKIAADAVTADKINVSTLSAISANLGTVTAGYIQSPTYSYSSGNYSTSGIQIGLTGAGYIRAKNFALDTSGNAYMKGTIDATSLSAKEDIKVYSSDSSAYESVIKAKSFDTSYKYVLFGFTGSTDTFVQIEKSTSSTGGHITLGGTYTDVYLSGYTQCNDELYVLGTISEGGQALSSKYAASDHTHSYLPLSGGTVTGQLVLSKTTDTSLSSSGGALLIGSASGNHLTFDPNEIVSKASGTTAGPLYINGDGGAVYLSHRALMASYSAVSDTTTCTVVIDETSSAMHLNGDLYSTGAIHSANSVWFPVNKGIYSEDTTSWLLRQYTSSSYEYMTVLGNTSYATSLYTSGNVWKNGSTSTYFATTSSSDRRLKEHVSDMSAYEDFFASLKPVAFKYHDGLYNCAKRSPLTQWGFYAQDVVSSFESAGINWRDQELVVVEDGDLTAEELKYAASGTLLKMNYQNMTALNTHMIQKNMHSVAELESKYIAVNSRIDTYEYRLQALQEQYTQILSENAQLKARIAQLEEQIA